MPSRRTVTIAAAGGVLYCAAVTLYLIVRGGFPTPDFLIPPLVLPALVARRGRAFVVDWAPFLLLLLAWEATRGIADTLGMPVQFTGPVTAEKLLFFGTIPTVALQEALFVPERGARWFDWLGAFMHALHFVLPVAFGFVLWLRGRALYWRYVASVLALFLLGFVGFVLYPQAPPWMAGEIDVIPFVHRISVETMLTLPTADGLIYVYQHIRPNNVAAMPSLHAAVPLLLTLILWKLNRRLALCGATYTVLLSFFLVYHGEHYVVDILAGWALAGLVYWLIWATPAWLSARLPAAPSVRRRVLALPATAVAAVVLVIGTAAVLRPNAFGSQPTALTPIEDSANQGAASTPAPVEAAATVQPMPAPVVAAQAGPCGSAHSLTAIADGLLAPVAGVYAAYLIDADLGLCLALTSSQSPPPPAIDDRRALVTRSLAALPSGAAAHERVGAGMLQVTMVGHPSAWLTTAGVPPGSYLLLIVLHQVTDDEAALRAAGGLARFVFWDGHG
jgi:hypothetical protein